MKKLLVVLILSAFATPAFASGQCYSTEEAKAERLIRLHSEMMVITVTCKQSSTGRDLVRAYTDFTRRNVSQIQQAEKTLIGYYAKTYGGKGVSQLDTLRTKLANEYGKESADLSAPVFCAQRRDRVLALNDSPASALQGESLRGYANARWYEPVCDKSLIVAEAGSSDSQQNPVKEAAPAVQKIKKRGKS